MGKKYVIDEETLTSIADAVRCGKGGAEKIPTTEFANEITAYLDGFRKLIEGGGVDLVIPYGTTKIGDLFFCHESTLKSIYIPTTVTSIGGAVFERGRGLKNIVIPDTVTEMGNYVFYGNYDIENVIIGDGVPSLGSEVFYQCASLKSITFGRGLKSIGLRCFAESSNCLTYDFSRCESVPTLSTATAFTGINADAKILVPDGLLSVWVSATNWTSYKDCITTPKNGFVFWNSCMTNDDCPTFGEWIDSEYNLNVFYADSSGWIWCNEIYGQLCYYKDDGSIAAANVSDTIVKGRNYFVS